MKAENHEVKEPEQTLAETEASEVSTHVRQNTIEGLVCDKIRERQRKGRAEHGATMERTDLSTLDWLIHAQEEAMDLAVYLEKLILSEHATPRSDGSGSPSAKEPRVPSVWREADDLIICKLPGLEEFRISNEGAELLRDQLNIVVDRLMSESSSPGSGLPKAEEE